MESPKHAGEVSTGCCAGKAGESATPDRGGCCPGATPPDARQDCCCGPAPGRRGWVRTLIFAVVMLAAIAVGAYALMSRSSPGSAAPQSCGSACGVDSSACSTPCCGN